MKKTLLASAIAALAFQASAGTVTHDGADLVIKTGGGFSVATTDGQFSFAPTGRFHLDYNNYDGVMAPGGDDGSDAWFRRARLGFKGHAGDFAYELVYNLPDSGSIDVGYLTYTGWGNMARLTIGQQKENFGLEELTSSNNITALERSLVSNAFSTGKNVGVKLFGGNEMFNYSIGVFKNGIDSDNELDEAVTGRVAFRPYYNDGDLLHIGAGYTMRSGSDADYNSRLGVRGGNDGDANRVRARYRDAAGTTLVGDRDDWNLEAALIMGPFHASAEYFKGEIDVDNRPVTIDAEGYYLQAGYVLTGERRGYSTSTGAFSGVKPSGDGGAWEVFARYDSLDLDNRIPTNLPVGDSYQILGEQGDTWTIGVNYYAKSLVRVGLNYVRANTDEDIAGEDRGDAIVARLQVAF